MAKIEKLQRSQELVQTFQGQPWIEGSAATSWQYQGSETRRQVFADLWHKGFYITDGTKFGGDFLAYPGDPIQFHAKYVIICCDEKELAMAEKDLVAKSRLATSVKKTVLLAFLAETKGGDCGKIRFKSVKWAERLL